MVAALMIQPGQNPVPCQLCDNREYLDQCISGNTGLVYTAGALRLENNIALIYCKNGYLFSLPCNRRIGDRIHCGVCYIVRVKNGKLVSLTDKDVVKYSLQYWHPEEYDDNEIIDSWLLP